MHREDKRSPAAVVSWLLLLGSHLPNEPPPTAPALVVEEVESRAHRPLELLRHPLRFLRLFDLLRRHLRSVRDCSPLVLRDFPLREREWTAVSERGGAGPHAPCGLGGGGEQGARLWGPATSLTMRTTFSPLTI